MKWQGMKPRDFTATYRVTGPNLIRELSPTMFDGRGSRRVATLCYFTKVWRGFGPTYFNLF